MQFRENKDVKVACPRDLRLRAEMLLTWMLQCD